MATNWSNITSPDKLLGIPNTNTYGLFWSVVVFLIWVILIIIFQGFGFEIALLSATFLTLIASLLLTYAGLIAWEWSLFFLGVLIFTIIYVVWSSNRDQ